MDSDRPASTSSTSDCHRLLFQQYFVLLQSLNSCSRLIWLPVMAIDWLRFIQIPVFRLAVQLFVSSHVRRVIHALDRAYQLRLAIDQKTPEKDDWKTLQAQTESMDAALPPFLLSKLTIAIVIIIIIVFIGFAFPQKDLATSTQMIVALITLNTEKFAELAAKPDAIQALGKIVLATLPLIFVLIFVLTPIIIYHFRFKRILFSCSELSSTIRKVPLETIWKREYISKDSVYMSEWKLFMSLGDKVLRETPIDLLPVILIYGCYALGPGLFVGIMGIQIFETNRNAGLILVSVGAVNMLIGVSNIIISVLKIKRRLNPLVAD